MNGSVDEDVPLIIVIISLSLGFYSLARDLSPSLCAYAYRTMGEGISSKKCKSTFPYPFEVMMETKRLIYL